MLTELEKQPHRRIGAALMLGLGIVLLLMAASAIAQTTILGELEFKGASKVEKTSGVWIDGQYVGYLSELWGPRRVLLLPGDHQLAVRQAGYVDFTEKLTVEPHELLRVPVKMQKAPEDQWPTVTGELKVDVQPDRSAVFVDGRFLGHAGELGGSFHSMLLSPGTHQIKVELPGYRSFEADVSVSAGQKSTVKAHLERASIHEADALIGQSSRQATSQASNSAIAETAK